MNPAKASKSIIFDLGRQPLIGYAELSRVFGSSATLIAPAVALVSIPADAPTPNISSFGGSKKSGVVISQFPARAFRNLGDFFDPSFAFIKNNLPPETGRISLGISVLGKAPVDVTPTEIIKLQGKIKKALAMRDIKTRFVEPKTLELSTAVSHHNKLGLSPNKIELFIVFGEKEVILAFSTGAQNISAYASRDQNRPFRSAFNGMLPPKLAQIVINLAVGGRRDEKLTILDPFCGSGTVLQEALLMGFVTQGTDKNPKMPTDSQKNIDWLRKKYHYLPDCFTEEADATNHRWKKPFDIVASEMYLGPPMSQVPVPIKLRTVRSEVEQVLYGFLDNISEQIEPGFTLCLAIPAWSDGKGGFNRMKPLDKKLDEVYNRVSISGISDEDMIYHREGQIVGRELLILEKV
jgi:tRNA G10  N-methylase Trm11